MEKNSKGWQVAVVILLILVLLLAGYVGYDKFFSKQEETSKESGNVNDQINDAQTDDEVTDDTTNTEEPIVQGSGSDAVKFYVGTVNGSKYYLTLFQHERTSVSSKAPGITSMACVYVIEESAVDHYGSSTGTCSIDGNQLTLRLLGNNWEGAPSELGKAFTTNNGGTSTAVLNITEQQVTVGNFVYERD